MNIELLKKSPMFNLSLSSKELFHSNFIAWLISINSKFMSSLFSDLLNEKINISNCGREKNNFDLNINCEKNCKGNKGIIIENKFKSIITEKQLEKYNKKLKNIPVIKVLLSLNDTQYEKKLAKKFGWKIISYKDLSKKLRELLEKLPFENKYHDDIIIDYCNFVSEISNYFLKNNYSKKKLSEIWGEYDKLKNIRLHDISQKIFFNYILTKLNYELNNSKDEKNFNKEKIDSWQDFWRGTGLVSLNYTLEKGKTKREGFRLELQFQYDSLKLMLIHDSPKNKSLKKFRDKYFKIIEELSNERYCKRKGELFPKNMKYGKYGENLIYKRIILSENLTTHKIIKLMINTFKKMIFVENSLNN